MRSEDEIALQIARLPTAVVTVVWEEYDETRDNAERCMFKLDGTFFCLACRVCFVLNCLHGCGGLSTFFDMNSE